MMRNTSFENKNVLREMNTISEKNFKKTSECKIYVATELKKNNGLMNV